MIAKQERESNIEVLRFLAMFFSIDCLITLNTPILTNTKINIE